MRLDGKPVSCFNAVERFARHAAGVATGFVGFAQVLWDDNRQAIHDEIAATVVVRE